MLSTTNLLVTNYSLMILMLTGIGSLLAWLLPTHCLHSLGILPPFQRAFRQCVGNVQAMWSVLPGRLLACLVPTDCLRSLENRPPFHRAFGQYVGNPETICSLYDKVRQQPDDSYAWTGQPFLSALKQIEMATSKGPGTDKIMNDPAFERIRENMAGSGRAGKAASVVRDRFSVHMLTFLKKLFPKNKNPPAIRRRAMIFYDKFLQWVLIKHRCSIYRGNSVRGVIGVRQDMDDSLNFI